MAKYRTTWVYLLEAICEGPPYYYKAGRTSNLPARLSLLQTGCPFTLRVHSKIGCSSYEDAVQLERTLLEDADAHNAIQRGEWIRSNGPLSAGFLIQLIDTETLDLTEMVYA